jgi:NADPH:quinone reductase-like Zn-dependent oxidoreductase
MKAVRMHRFGGPEALSVDDIETPEPGQGEALVRVRAASVNPVDTKIRSGAFPIVKQEQLPIVLGRDIAGVVEGAGPGAACKPGDEIYALLGRDRGGYAEFVIVKPGEFAPEPRRLSFVEAAAAPLAGLTAWQGLFDEGGLSSGQRVLIHGGAGGVGHLAIQFAKAKGAWVATTVSGADIEFVRQLGADQAVDYRAQRFEDEVAKVDLAYDPVGGETQKRSFAVLKEGGTLVSAVQPPDEALCRQHNVRGKIYGTKPDAAELAEIGRLIDDGKVRPVVTRTFPLRRAAEAQEALEKGHIRGKIVLVVA